VLLFGSDRASKLERIEAIEAYVYTNELHVHDAVYWFFSTVDHW